MTCRKAREFLAHKGVSFAEREFFQQRLSEDELRKILGKRSPRELFAWKSVKAREQRLAADQFSDEQLLRMMVEEPTFIRRPLLRLDGEWLAGFSQKEWERALSQ